MLSPVLNYNESTQYIIVGMSHKTAPVAMREQVAFSMKEISTALKAAAVFLRIKEIVIISTCNRLEIYCAGGVCPQRVLAWLGYYHNIEMGSLSSHFYIRCGQDAVKHMMRVMCGLDSLIIGESQIVGQMKTAFELAQKQGQVGSLLMSLFQAGFVSAKKVRSQTAVGKFSVSVAYTATKLASQIFSDLMSSTAVIIGAGATGQLVTRHLYGQGMRKISVVNRTFSHAHELAAEFSGTAYGLDQLEHALLEADIIITSTASTVPIVTKQMIETVLKYRKNKPLFIVDLAVPRDIDHAVDALSNVFLYTVDDLQDVIEDNLQKRHASESAAEDIISQEVSAFIAKLRTLNVVEVLRCYREKTQGISKVELQRAQAQLARGESPDSVLTKLAHALTNKLMHSPCVQLKKAAAANEYKRIEWAKELLDINDEHVTTE